MCWLFLSNARRLLNKPVEEWPECEVLIAFYSDGFPLKKAQEYAELRQPLVFNDVKKQEVRRGPDCHPSSPSCRVDLKASQNICRFSDVHRRFSSTAALCTAHYRT